MSDLALDTRSSQPARLTARRAAILRAWLWSVAALVVLMIAVGGATRLTDSGLSIVEWRPVTGVIPPLTTEAWEAELEKYRQIPEYQIINKGMSLDAFKVIYWWEWGHRFLGRIIGLVFFVPFVTFLALGWIGRGLSLRLWALFLLGGLQGAIGWWMVTSGLADRVDVSQYRLAVHLGVAFLILGLIVWTVRDLTPGIDPSSVAPRPDVTWQAGALMVLAFVQILIGALVAGLDAGLGFATWPLMNGQWIPDRLFVSEPWHLSLFEDPLTVQFNHRGLAYLLIVLALVHWLWTRRRIGASPEARTALFIFLALFGQAALGIATLLSHVPVSLALLHQSGAVIVLGLAVMHLHRLTGGTRATIAA